MLERRLISLGLALTLGAPMLLACAPQVVDAVDTKPETGGSTSMGGSTSRGGSTSTGGNGGTAGSIGGESSGGGGKACPDGGTSCDDLAALIAHRYTFAGPSDSTLVVDSQAGADGQVINTFLSGDDTLVLEGGATDQYVELPNGLASAQASATFEAWLLWDGGGAWQRIFDFGSNNGPGQGIQGSAGSSYLFFAAATLVDTANPLLLLSGKLRLVYRRVPLEPELIVEAPMAFPSGGTAPTHVAAVIDAEKQRMSIYLNGQLQGGVAFVAYGPDGSQYVVVNNAGPYDWSLPLTELGGARPPPIVLEDLIDINSWLGRSNFRADDELGGTYYEFRIYHAALTDEQIAKSYEAGPDPAFFE